MRCHISTGCFQTNNLDEILAIACKQGFDLELSSSLTFYPAMLDSLFKAKSRLNYLIHNYFPPPSVPFVLNLASNDLDTHSRSVNHCKEAICLCADLGVPSYSVHAGFAIEMSPGMLGNPRLQKHACVTAKIDREKSYRIFVDTIRPLADFAALKQVDLLVENNVVAVENICNDGTFPLLLADVQEIKTFFIDLCRPDVGLLLDTGHAKVSAETLKVDPRLYFDELEPFIKCLHLSDNDGRRDNNRPFSSSSWFVTYLRKYESMPMVVEVYNCSRSEIADQRGLLMNLLD